MHLNLAQVAHLVHATGIQKSCVLLVYKTAKEKLNDGKQHLRLYTYNKLLAGLIAILLPHKLMVKDSLFLTIIQTLHFKVDLK